MANVLRSEWHSRMWNGGVLRHSFYCCPVTMAVLAMEAKYENARDIRG